jgi:hypothetical protein
LALRLLAWLALAALAAGCTTPAQQAQPLASGPWDAVVPDPAAQPSAMPACEGLRWELEPGDLRAGAAATLQLRLVNPCDHAVQVAHSQRQPTLWVEQASGREVIYRAELVLTAFLDLDARSSKAWTYDWTPAAPGDAVLRVDYPELLREYQGLRMQGFPAAIS